MWAVPDPAITTPHQSETSNDRYGRLGLFSTLDGLLCICLGHICNAGQNRNQWGDLLGLEVDRQLLKGAILICGQLAESNQVEPLYMACACQQKVSLSERTRQLRLHT
jgi:hypothetical protein